MLIKSYLFSFGFIWLRSAGKNVISLIKAVTIVITDNIPNSIVGLNSDKVSIKNASGSSTQVHLTTQKHFIEQLGLNGNASIFVRLFCGSPAIDNEGTDRFKVDQIHTDYTDAFRDFLNENKEKVVIVTQPGWF